MKRLVLLITVLVLAGVAGYATWNWVLQNRENTWQVEMAKALAAHSAKHDADAENILTNLLPNAEKWWPNGPHLIETLSWLGGIYRVEHKYDLAEPLLKRAIELSEENGAAPTIAVGRAKLNLGIIARDEPDDVAAENRFSEAAAILGKDPRAAWGDDDAALLNLGFLANKQGHYQEAESYLTRAVTGYDTLFVRTPEPDRANAHFNLGEVYRHLGDDAHAAEQYQASLDIYRQIEGPQGRDVRNCVSGLAIVQQGEGALTRSHNLTERSLEISKSLGEVDGASLNNLANVARDQEKYGEAESLYLRSCRAYEKSKPPDDAGLATALANLGKLYRDKQQFDMRKAEPLLKRALAIREKVLGPEHPQTANTLSDLSLLYFYEKNPATAEGYAKRALPLEEKTFGAGSLQVSTTLNRLGISERDLGKFKEAESNLKRALSIREEKSAPDSWIAISLENLASVYSVQGQDAKAMPLMARARAIRSHSSNN